MRPLADVRIVALEQYGAGPFGSLHLAHLGADVIKIEDPASRGDVGRYVPPFADGEDSLFFETFNRNKRSISLDLRHLEARGVFEDLVRGSDVVYSNLRGDQPAKLRLTYDDLKVPSPYNTYLHAGLPPTPIANPSLASLRAALSPAAGPWLYYLVVDPDGHEFFTASYAEFSAKKAQVQG